MQHTILKLGVAAVGAGLVLMILRDFYLGRAPAVRDGFVVRYARREEAPLLFWLFSLGRAFVVGIVLLALFRL